MAGKPSSAQLAQYKRVFNEVDVSGDGSVSKEELFNMLDKGGFTFSRAEFKKIMSEIDSDDSGQVSFDEFCSMAFQLQQSYTEAQKMKKDLSSSTNPKTPRLFLNPEQFDQYRKIFEERAGDDLRLDVVELDEFFKSVNITIAPDRLKAIMQEVDDDQSGYLEEEEFMILLVKAMRMKRRKVGPGMCPMKKLLEEGWSLLDLKLLGYEVNHFLDAKIVCAELLSLFTIGELRKGGIPVQELLSAGWDGSGGKSAGFGLQDLVTVSCPIQKIRTAGYNDLDAAVGLRKLGIDAKGMKRGGFSLSELKMSGFSTADLRLAGFSTAALQAMQQSLWRQIGGPKLQRRNTFHIRHDLENKAKEVEEDGEDRPNTTR